MRVRYALEYDLQSACFHAFASDSLPKQLIALLLLLRWALALLKMVEFVPMGTQRTSPPVVGCARRR